MTWTLLLACAPEEESFVPVFLGTVSASAEAVDGSGDIVVEGDATWASAHGFDDGGDPGVVYVVILPALGVSCADAARFMENSADAETLMPPGQCTVSLTSSRYQGDLDVSASEDAPTTDAIVSVTCAQEGGQWNDRDGGGQAFDAFTSQAVAGEFRATLSGGDGEGYAWSLDASGFRGQFPQSLDYQGIEGAGTLAGAGSAEWCDDFGGLGIFD